MEEVPEPVLDEDEVSAVFESHALPVRKLSC